MKVESMTKALAWIAILGGIARIGMSPSAVIWGTDSDQELTFAMIACCLMTIGWFGIHYYQSHKTGVTGFISYVLITLSNTLTTCLVWSQIMGSNTGTLKETVLSINSGAALLGMIMFAIQTVRARIYPVWPVALFLLFPVASFIPLVTEWATTLWGLAYIGFGLYIVADKTVKNKSVYSSVSS
ncbi:hypothetical protein ACFPVX_11685 [Cohnella faecalis]|uniref:Uncharacterized protein n=1 Tax=Cohnella faecalis TaxID=2315694 RepID=A0A398CML7_9BACL|nr:hypothetical protein [Cohnella faecalis]RIE03705.1 hypothetical protein D3H35_10435 [Cohnella faecalis]